MSSQDAHSISNFPDLDPTTPPDEPEPLLVLEPSGESGALREIAEAAAVLNQSSPEPDIFDLLPADAPMHSGNSWEGVDLLAISGPVETKGVVDEVMPEPPTVPETEVEEPNLEATADDEEVVESGLPGGGLLGLEVEPAQVADVAMDGPALATPSGRRHRGRGTSMVLAGAALLFLSCWLACLAGANAAGYFRLVEEGDRSSWLARVGKTSAFLQAAGALALLILSLGALRLRRWSPKFMHACGWLVAICFLMALAVISASYFFITKPGAEGKYGLTPDVLSLLLGGTALGVVLPLGFIAIFQRPVLWDVCEEADEGNRWSDVLTEPVIMVSLLCLAGIAGAVAALFLGVPFPLLEGYLTGPRANGAWAGVFGICIIAVLLNLQRRKPGWWLGLALFSIVAALFVVAFARQPIERFWVPLGAPGGVSESTSKHALMFVAAAFIPVLLVFFMARSSYQPIDDTGAGEPS